MLVQISTGAWHDLRQPSRTKLASKMQPSSSLCTARRMQVVVLDDYLDTVRHLPCFAKLADHDVTIFNDHVEDVEELAERLSHADALVLFRERTKITEALLRRLPKLRLISQRSVYPHVDVSACSRHGVLLCSDMHADVPNYAAAEHTWALIMASTKNIPSQVASCREGRWQTAVGKTLRGRTLGIYGYGRIGKVVAGFARSFSMNVVWWASEAGRARAEADGEPVAQSRQAFFAGADVVTVHVRSTAATKGCISRADLEAMRPDALFVNTSRAALVEPGALLAALDVGRPGFAAVDVLDKEPLTDPTDPFVTHPRVLATPHSAFMTEDELDIQFATPFDQVNAFAVGSPINMVNPEAAEVHAHPSSQR